MRDGICIALVLGGGGARGGAHLGVIQELERLKIPVDIVVGTSIGAFVGGLYASGYSSDNIEQRLNDLNWAAGFQDRVGRDEMPVRRKQQYDTYSIRTNLGVDSSGVKLPSGVFLGQAMAELVSDAYGVQPDYGHFDELAIPFRAIATDLTNQEVVILDHGSLTRSIQASMSIPGVVRPVKLNGRLLVDGGVSNNLAIDVAKQLGADHVIAVDIGLPPKTEQELDSALAITEQLTGFLVQQGVARQLPLLNKQDILLRPEGDEIGTLAFEKIIEAVQNGRDAVQQNHDQIARYSIPDDQYKLWQQTHQPITHRRLVVDRISLENNSRLSDDVILSRLGVTPGQEYLPSQINQGLRKVYALGTFERVSHQLKTNTDDELELFVNAAEKHWGPNYINFRFVMEDDFSSDKHVQLGGAFTVTNLTELGAEWRNEIVIGTDKLFSTELYWPFFSPETYISSKLKHSSKALVIEEQRGLTLGEFRRSENAFSLNVGWNPNDQIQLETGWSNNLGTYELPSIFSDIIQDDEIKFNRSGPQLSFIWDSLNDNSFPTHGIQFKAHWNWYNEEFRGTKFDSKSQSLAGVGVGQWREHIIKVNWEYDSFDSSGEGTILEQFSLGGLFRLSGYPKNYLFGSDTRLTTATYMYRLHENKMSIFNSPLYLGASLERGKVTNSLWQANSESEDWIWAGSIFLGWDSIIGPIYLAYGQAESVYLDRARQFYLSIGQPF